MLELNCGDGVEDGIDLTAQVIDIGKSSPSEVFLDPVEQPVVGQSNIQGIGGWGRIWVWFWHR